MSYVLVVEDDASVARFLSRGLIEEGFNVDVCADGALALEQGVRQGYDMMIVDWMLPGLDGVSLVRAWRERGVSAPILMLTARDGTDAVVCSLDAGADDYMNKPYSFEELLARLRALGRRLQPASDPADSRQQVTLGAFTFDVRQRVLLKPNVQHELSNREFSLLDLLVRYRGEVLGRARILDRVWGMSHDPTTNVVDVYIRYLRTKLEHDPDRPIIETIRGRGYRLRTQEEYEQEESP
jgi:two-component system OmpR family response regulator